MTTDVAILGKAAKSTRKNGPVQTQQTVQAYQQQRAQAPNAEKPGYTKLPPEKPRQFSCRGTQPSRYQSVSKAETKPCAKRSADGKVKTPKKKNKAKQKQQPCGYDTVTITCKHCTGQRGKRFKGPKKYTLATQPPSVISVVAGEDAGKGDTIELAMEGGPGYCSSATHPAIQVWAKKPNGSSVLKSEQGKKISFEANARKPPPALRGNLPKLPFIEALGRHWWPDLRVGEYQVNLLACGVSKRTTKPLHSSKSITVKAYPADKYEFGLAFPAVKKTDREVSKDKNNNPWKQKAPHMPPPKKKKHRGRALTPPKGKKSRVTVGGDVSVQTDTKPPDPKWNDVCKSIYLKRQNGDLTHELKVDDALKNLKTIKDCYENLEQILKSIPKVGFYYDWSWEMLSGACKGEWHYKEYDQDWHVYPWWQFTASLTLIKGSVEAGFGVSIWPVFKAAIFIKGSGEISIEAQIYSLPPFGSTVGGRAQVKGAVGLDVGAKASLLGDYIQFEAKISTGLEATAGLSVEPALAIDAALEFKGAKATVSAKRGARSYKHLDKELWKPAMLWQGKLSEPFRRPRYQTYYELYGYYGQSGGTVDGASPRERERARLQQLIAEEQELKRLIRDQKNKKSTPRSRRKLKELKFYLKANKREIKSLTDHPDDDAPPGPRPTVAPGGAS